MEKYSYNLLVLFELKVVKNGVVGFVRKDEEQQSEKPRNIFQSVGKGNFY